jgi:competence ComEA-like helix-hairpin-helix protein
MHFRFWIPPAILAAALWAPQPAPAQNDSAPRCASCVAVPPQDGPPPRLDINTAGVEQFDQLPGVSPATAAMIVRVRQRNGPFRNVDELRAVPGLSEKRFALLRERVTVLPRQNEAESPAQPPDSTSTKPQRP